MEAATAAGVSRRRWCGWEPATVTTYTYDESGRVETAVTTVEPEWDESTRAWHVAYAEFLGRLCPGCGTDMAESTAVSSYGAYEVLDPSRCYKCEVLHIASERVHRPTSDGGYSTPGSMHMRVRYHGPQVIPGLTDGGGG